MKEHTIRKLIADVGSEPPWPMKIVGDDGVRDFTVTREDLEVSPNGERAMARAFQRAYPETENISFKVEL